MELIDKEMNKLISSSKVQNLLNEIYSNSNDNVFPSKENVFKAFELCPLSQTKVVILGQDPYYQPGVADGLAFSTQNSKCPASLRNIYQEIKNEYNYSSFKSNDLSCWAKQGVLLLNTSLTVIENKPLSHANNWTFFIDEVLSLINLHAKDIVFLLWGLNSFKWYSKIDKSKHFIFYSSHPSPLSVNKGFFGNGHFRLANETLKKLNKKEIDWNIY